MEGSEKANITDVACKIKPFFLNFRYDLENHHCDCKCRFLRARDTQVNEHGPRSGLENKQTDVGTDLPAERDPEDLAGRVCYELEPLVVS